jgi:glucosylglycerate synthase
MATANPIPEMSPAPSRTGASLLVMFAATPADQLESVLDKLIHILPAEELLVAAADLSTVELHPELRVVAVPETKAYWTFTAGDFVRVYALAQKHEARAILMLGPEADSLSPTALFDLCNAVVTTPNDLTMPRYQLPANAGLVNSAILYPLTRALFSQRARFPMAVDLGLSLRMAERLAAAGQRFAGANQGTALVWPLNEAAVSGYIISEMDVGTRELPLPLDADLNSILALVAGSLFADIEAKAAFWQRSRSLPPARSILAQPLPSDAAADVTAMLDSFRLAYTNLREIWSLVLPPNSLLGLKRLSLTDAATFRMPESLWARIIYDFLLAYRLRTINRGHLLGALTPLYLAWVASHINVLASGTEAERHVEAVAAAFEAEKAYLVSRWRWPDRFNP